MNGDWERGLQSAWKSGLRGGLKSALQWLVLSYASYHE